MRGSLTALLGVKDECELISASIAHLRRIGVDHVCVLDYGSTDGTLDIVQTACRRGEVTLHHVDPNVVVDYDTSSEHDLALARATGGEWVVVLDADEFWLPVTGSLRDCIEPSTADIVVAERYNVALAEEGLLMPEAPVPARYPDLHLLARSVPNLQVFVETHPWEPFISLPPGHKVMGRVAHAAAITPGGHDLQRALPTTRWQMAADVIVAHVAFSTWPRFDRKVRNIRAEMVRHPALFAGTYAWHWRRWAAMTARELRYEFEQQVATRRCLRNWRLDGHLRTAEELLAPSVSEAVSANRARELPPFQAVWRALSACA